MSHLAMEILKGNVVNFNVVERNARRGEVSKKVIKDLRDVLLVKGDVCGSRRMARLLKVVK